MKRYYAIEPRRPYVPQGTLDMIARQSNDWTGEIRHHSTDDRFLPPSIKVSSTTKRWLQSIEHVETSMYVVRGPSNIMPIYYGISGANLSITPVGGLAAIGGDVRYIILDKDRQIITAPTVLQFGGVNETVRYRIYAIDDYGNFSYVTRFVLKSVTSDVVNNDMVVANITWSLPDHVANSSIGSITPSWVATSVHTDVMMQIMSVNNIALEPTLGIPNTSNVSFRVYDKGSSVGDEASFTYRLYTAEGNVSAIETVSIPMISNTAPLLDGFVSNFPDTVLKGQIVSWLWGGGLDIDGDTMTADLILLSGVDTANPFNIPPGVVVPIAVTGEVGDTVVINIRLKDRFGVSKTRRITSSIIVDPPILTDMTVLLDGEPIESQVNIRPCDAVRLSYSGIVDTSGRDITISVSSPDATFSTTVMGQGVETVMSVPCGFDSATQLEVNAIISNGVSSVTRTDYLTITKITGHELVNYSRVFIKPAGVTALTIIGKGGIGDSTVLTGLISHTFVGNDTTATDYPPLSTVYFDNLTGDSAAITVTLAENTNLNIHF